MAMIEDVDDLDLIPDEELEETYLERIAGLKGTYFKLYISMDSIQNYVGTVLWYLQASRGRGEGVFDLGKVEIEFYIVSERGEYQLPDVF